MPNYGTGNKKIMFNRNQLLCECCKLAGIYFTPCATLQHISPLFLQRKILKQYIMRQLHYYLKQVTWGQVKNVLTDRHPNYSQRMMRAFKSAFYDLKSQNPVSDNRYIQVYKDDTWAYYSHTRNEEEWLELSIFPWANCLGMYVIKEPCKHITNAEIAASCLWAMTYFGFNEKTIIRRLNQGF
jgi:hypothetical protein